jgi:hypothetical protein
MSTPVPDTIAKYESSSSSTTIEEVLSKADAPPQVLLFHIQGILMYLHQDDEFYEDFSYFGERIRYLKLLLQEQKHRTMKELLHNSRQASMVDVPARSDRQYSQPCFALGSLVTSVFQT